MRAILFTLLLATLTFAQTAQSEKSHEVSLQLRRSLVEGDAQQGPKETAGDPKPAKGPEPNPVQQGNEVKGADKTSTDKTSTDKTSTDKTSTDKTSTDKTSTDKTSTDKTSTDKTSTDKTSTDKTSTDKTSTDKTSTDKTSTDKTSTDKTSTDKTVTEKTDTAETQGDTNDKTDKAGVTVETNESRGSGSDKTSTDKTSTDKTSTDKTVTDKTSTDKTVTDKTSTAEKTDTAGAQPGDKPDKANDKNTKRRVVKKPDKKKPDAPGSVVNPDSGSGIDQPEPVEKDAQQDQAKAKVKKDPPQESSVASGESEFLSSKSLTIGLILTNVFTATMAVRYYRQTKEHQYLKVGFLEQATEV